MCEKTTKEKQPCDGSSHGDCEGVVRPSGPECVETAVTAALHTATSCRGLRQAPLASALAGPCGSDRLTFDHLNGSFTNRHPW